MANWRRRFDEPIHLRDGTVIRTLADARAWLLAIDSDRNESRTRPARHGCGGRRKPPEGPLRGRHGRIPQHEAGRQKVKGLRNHGGRPVI